MVEITRVLNLRKDGSYQLNLSVKAELAQTVADSMAYLMCLEVGWNRSQVVCQAIIEHARARGFTGQGTGGTSDPRRCNRCKDRRRRDGDIKSDKERPTPSGGHIGTINLPELLEPRPLVALPARLRPGDRPGQWHMLK
jgi:hypothetical protein